MKEELIKNGFIKDFDTPVFSKKSNTNDYLQMRVILMNDAVCVQFGSINSMENSIDKWSTGFTIEQINNIYDKFNDLVA